MADSVLSYTENVQKKKDQLGLQLTTGLKSSLLVAGGKAASALLEEFTEEQQAKIKEVFGFVSETLLKKADPSYSGKAAEIVTEIEGKIETAEPAPEPEPAE